MGELCEKKEGWEQGKLFDLPHDHRRPIGNCVLQAVKNGSEEEVIPGSHLGQQGLLVCPPESLGGCGGIFTVQSDGSVQGIGQCRKVRIGGISLLRINPRSKSLTK